MKRYKSFGETGKPTAARRTMSIDQYTPTQNIPMMDVPQHVQYQEYQREDEGVGFSNRAIRNFNHNTGYNPQYNQPQYTQPQYQPQYQPQPQYTQPQYPPQYNPPQYNQSQEIPSYKEDICDRVLKHIKNCPSCNKKYMNNDVNYYITIIVGLLLFIMFLLTKIIDKFS